MDIIIYIVIILVVILISMTLHEVMHGYVAYWLGDNTAKDRGRLTLNPLKHIDPFMTIILPIILAISGLPIFGGAKPVPYNPHNVKYGEWGAALVALVGPLTNFLVAFIFYGIWVTIGRPGDMALEIFQTIVYVNLGFAVFNTIPIPPLDGSRILYALAPEFIRRGMEFIERYGVFVVFIIVMLLSPFIGPLMGGAINGIINFFDLVFR